MISGKDAYERRIRRERCEDRRLYRLYTRNLEHVAVYDAAQKAFVGMREKFGHFRIDREFHVDNGPPFGTATPYEALDVVLPPEIGLNESGPTMCFACKQPVEWRHDDPSYRRPGPGELWNAEAAKGRWHHLAVSTCAEQRGVTFENKELREWLQRMEKAYPRED